MTILNQICPHHLPISNIYSHHFIMCSFNHLSFNNYFHSKGNSKSNSPFYQNFHVFSSFSKLQSKDLLGAPHSFLFSLKMQSQDFCTSTSASIHPTLRLLSSLVCLCPAAPPLQAFKIRTHSLAFIHSFQAMQSCVETLPYISVQTMQFHVDNSKYGPNIKWPLSPSPVVPAPCISSTPPILQSRPDSSKVNPARYSIIK